MDKIDFPDSGFITVNPTTEIDLGVTDARKMPTKQLNRSAVDEIRIKHEIRFKDSPASGSEWRTNVVADLMFKGEIVASTSAWDVRTALLEALMLFEKPHKFNDTLLDKLRDTKCCQDGCSADATVFYRIKEDYCRSCSQKDKNYPKPCWSPREEYSRRNFCDAHAHRGNQSYNDSDANYDRIDKDGNLIAATPVSMPDPAVVSVFGMVII